jgi:hypothetical protein
MVHRSSLKPYEMGMGVRQSTGRRRPLAPPAPRFGVLDGDDFIETKTQDETDTRCAFNDGREYASPGQRFSPAPPNPQCAASAGHFLASVVPLEHKG